MNKSTGVKTKIEDNGRDFVMKLKVPRPGKSRHNLAGHGVNLVACYAGECAEGCNHGAMWSVLEEEEKTFHWQP